MRACYYSYAGLRKSRETVCPGPACTVEKTRAIEGAGRNSLATEKPPLGASAANQASDRFALAAFALPFGETN